MYRTSNHQAFLIIIFSKVFIVFISLLAIFSFVTEVFLLGELLALRRTVECWGCHLAAFQHAVVLSGSSLKDAELLARDSIVFSTVSSIEGNWFTWSALRTGKGYRTPRRSLKKKKKRLAIYFCGMLNF